MHKTLIYARSLLLLLLLATTAAVVAQDEEPQRPEAVYRYVATDTGDAIEIDWAIEDGYYLYRNKLAFESNTGNVVFGDARLPEGLAHEDEFFGKQQIYRENFYVSIPYRIDGERPAAMDLVIKSQGCWDGGLCYPPQVWTDEVKLRQKDKPKLELATLGQTGGLGNSEFVPVDEAFKPILIPVDGNTVEVTFRVTPGYYLYKDKISVAALSDKVQLGKLDLPKGESKFDEFFGESEVYFDDVFATLPLARATPEAMELELEVNFQGCAEGGLCYPPTTRVVTTLLPEATTVTDLASLPSRNEPTSEQGRLAQVITGSSIWVTIGVFFVAGLGLAFTPCVLPMVPILSGIIAGEGDNVSPARGFTLALSYVMGMALIYTAAGVAAAAAGLQLQATFNQPWILILFSGLFVVLAFGMFGAFELQMPSSIQSKLAGASGNQKSGTMIGAFVMGAISALVVTACVAPALIAALTVMAQTGDMLRGGTALFAMSLGMGAPLLAVGAAQGKLLPKAGAWMVAVKGAFGFMFLGLGIWMMSRILPGGVTLALWAVLVFMIGVFMGGLTTLSSDSSIAEKLGKGFGVLAILYGLLLFLGALTGGSNPLKPLATVSFGGGVMLAEEEHLKFQRIKTVADLDREIAAAAAAGRTAMLDFYADWCVSCIEMEEYTFTDAGVQAALADTVLLQADVTANDEQDQELLQRFGVFGPPTIIFFGADGQQRHGYEVVGYMKAKDFADHLQQAFAAAATMSAQSQEEGPFVRRPFLIFVAAFVALMAGALFYAARIPVEHAQEATSTPPASNDGAGSVYPSFKLADLDGNTHDFSEWNGNHRLLNFWATWCAPCRREIPLLKAFQDEHGDNGFIVIGIAVDFPEQVAAYAEEAEFNYPILVGQDDAMAVAETSGVEFIGMPFTMIVAADGELINTHIGEIMDSHLEHIVRVLTMLDNGEIDKDSARKALNFL